MERKPELPLRIRRKLRAQRGCWVWKGYVNPKRPYAQVSWQGRKVSAHRLVYELMVGPIPDGLEIDHLCRVTHCVNPAHLEPVTRAENIRRSLAARAALRNQST